MGQFFAVSRHAFIEALRQQVYVVLLLLVSGLLSFNPVLSKFTLDDDNKLLIDLGLSTVMLGGLILSAFTAATVFRRELEDGTILTIVSKPVPRSLFVFGKYTGIAAAVTVALWIWSLVYLLSLRHGVMQTARDTFDVPVLVVSGTATALALGIAMLANFFRGKHFGGTLTSALVVLLTFAYAIILSVDRSWSLQPVGTDLNPQVLAALLLVIEAAWLFSAVAVCVATRLGHLSTLVICVFVFLMGLSSDHFFGSHAAESTVAAVCHRLIPNMQYLWLADALTQDHPVEARYLLLTSAYTGLFVVGTLCLAAALFRREVASA